MNITVYLGANEGNDPSLRKAVRELGTWIGESGNRLVYGGSKSGLMGEIAESVLQAGGEVTGVEPQFFIDMEYQYDAITELIVTKDMTERKTKMIELGVEEYLKELKEVGPDALIIADPGVFELAKEICPEIQRHVSTQANNTNYATYQFWWKQGASRVVSAMELC